MVGISHLPYPNQTHAKLCAAHGRYASAGWKVSRSPTNTSRTLQRIISRIIQQPLHEQAAEQTVFSPHARICAPAVNGPVEQASAMINGFSPTIFGRTLSNLRHLNRLLFEQVNHRLPKAHQHSCFRSWERSYGFRIGTFESLSRYYFCSKTDSEWQAFWKGTATKTAMTILNFQGFAGIIYPFPKGEASRKKVPTTIKTGVESHQVQWGPVDIPGVKTSLTADDYSSLCQVWFVQAAVIHQPAPERPAFLRVHTLPDSDAQFYSALKIKSLLRQSCFHSAPAEPSPYATASATADPPSPTHLGKTVLPSDDLLASFQAPTEKWPGVKHGMSKEEFGQYTGKFYYVPVGRINQQFYKDFATGAAPNAYNYPGGHQQSYKSIEEALEKGVFVDGYTINNQQYRNSPPLAPQGTKRTECGSPKKPQPSHRR